MGLKPEEIDCLTLIEFVLMDYGRFKREEKEWNHTRHIMSYTLNFGGFGAKKFVPAHQIWPLELDKEGVKRFITTKFQALELLEGFE